MKRLLIFLFFLIPLLLQAQQVSNAHFTQVGNKVLIEFYLDKEADITIFLKVGNTRKQLTCLTGNAGAGVQAGHCRVYWDVQQEIEGLQSNNVRFEIIAKPHYRNSFFFTLNGAYCFNTTPSIGITIGQEIKHFGWYATAMSGWNFSSLTATQNIDKQFCIDNIMPFYTGQRAYTRISLTAGAIFRIYPSIAFYLGAGYGYCGQTWELNNGDWARYTPTTFHGADIQTGVHLNLKGCVLRAGITTTNFKTIEATIGIGGAFKQK